MSLVRHRKIRKRTLKCASELKRNFGHVDVLLVSLKKLRNKKCRR